jgi:glycosyltransferase involved in cell wall biosynthesis
MKILHIACVAPPQTGGIGQAASEIVKRLIDRGHEATLVAPALKTKLAEGDPEWVKRLPAMIRYGNAAVMGGLNPFLKWADIIHLHYPCFGTAEKVAQYALMHPNKSLVMTFHMDATGGNILTDTFFDLYRMFAQYPILRAAKKIFVSSYDYAEHSSLASFKKSHPELIVELSFGVDERFFVHRTSTIDGRKRFGLPLDAKVIGFVGAMDHAHPFKGINELLEALSALPSDHHALLVGDGDRRRVYEAKAKELGIADRAHFAGRLPSDELPHAYAAMDVFAFPSTSAGEAFGLAAAEAQAMGVPVVASALPGVRTVVLDGKTGLLIPPKDREALRKAILRMISDDALRTAFGESARHWAKERFDWNRHVDALEEVYRALI